MKMTVRYAIQKIEDLKEFKSEVKEVFERAQTTNEERDYGFLCGRVFSMIDKEIKRIEELETTEEL